MGSCQNYGPFWGTRIIRCRIIFRTQKGTIILTTTHMQPHLPFPASWHGTIELLEKSLRSRAPEQPYWLRGQAPSLGASLSLLMARWPSGGHLAALNHGRSAGRDGLVLDQPGNELLGRHSQKLKGLGCPLGQPCCLKRGSHGSSDNPRLRV